MARTSKASGNARRPPSKPGPPGIPLLRAIGATDLMLATRYRAPFSAPGWLYELKYDGFRCLIRKSGDCVELVSRNGNPFNASFPDVAAAVADISGDFVWDAELTVDDTGGHSSFDRLQKRAKTSIGSRVRAAALAHPARLYVFDILAVGNRDLRGLPLLTRKGFLRDSFADTAELVFVNGIVEAGEWVFEQVESLRFEGMIAKRLESAYQRGRSHDWRKVKFAGYGRPAALGFRNK
jgi:bifunctional non-homologous end joining protein LigD